MREIRTVRKRLVKLSCAREDRGNIRITEPLYRDTTAKMHERSDDR